MTEVVRQAERRSAAAWPAATFDAAVLRGLDDRARRELADAGALRSLGPRDVVYRPGESGESFFVVVSGTVALRATRRGDADDSELRLVEAGDAFGEEAVVGAPRAGTAIAHTRATVAEVPVTVYLRAAKRGGAESAERLERALRRGAARDLLSTSALGRELAERELERLLDGVRWLRFERGAPIYRSGDPARELFIVADGLVQIQSENGARVRVRAYVGRGDFFGDDDLDTSSRRSASAIASGPTVLLAVPAPLVRELAEKDPELLPRLRRVFVDQRAAQQALFDRAANATQHLLRDVYRLEVARSLLVIDLETCVRCGHCAWTCADLYGVARLVRRGDKIATRGDGAEGDLPASVMLPNSCQHCENPACMKECPTGAIGRDREGDVFIRDALCTGCSACAKACPWDNIAMAPRPGSAPRPSGGAFPDIAVKCDLCRSYERGPACVQACPTGSIFRINPMEEVADLRDLFGARAPSANASTAREPAPGRAAAVPFAGAAIAATGIAVAGAALQARGALTPRGGLGLAAGIAAAIGFVLLLAYAVPKRGARFWMRLAPRTREAPARSIVRPQAALHGTIGVLTLGVVFAHAPWPIADPTRFGVALELAFVATSIVGLFVAAAYRIVPKRLARIERTARLPEDLAGARRDLLDRLYRQMTGRSDLVKKIAETSLLRYARAPLGFALLLASGRSLKEEERVVRARIDAALEGRGAERLAGLDDLIRTVVELRALAAQRWLQRALRVGLPAHVVTFGVALALLVVHVAVASGALRR